MKTGFVQLNYSKRQIYDVDSRTNEKLKGLFKRNIVKDFDKS